MVTSDPKVQRNVNIALGVSIGLVLGGAVLCTVIPALGLNTLGWGIAAVIVGVLALIVTCISFPEYTGPLKRDSR
jgi:hypothetical protein